MDELIDITKASKLFGVSTKTLRRWDNEGKLKAYRTMGGHRRYKLTDKELEIKGGENSENNNESNSGK